MGRELTPAELLVMGLLAERPRHGYDLDQVIAERGMREWTPVAFSSLYYLLRKLETDGLITPVTDGDKRRRVYTPTSAGEQLTTEATRRALATLSPPHPPVLIGLANAPMLDPATTVEALRTRSRAVTAELERLTAHRDQQTAGAPRVVATLFDYALTMLDAELGWIRRTIESLETPMPKVDLKRDQRDLYAAPTGKYVEVQVPPMRYLAVDGGGSPGSPGYQGAVEALFAAAYAAKFLSRNELDRDYVVLPLEGLWWADDMTTFRTREKERWSWRMLIRQPDWLDDRILTTAIDQARAKGRDPDGLLRVVDLDEGRCLQTLHIGSYDDEGPILAFLHDEYLPARGLRPTGLHHEIYLSDARRVAPDKLRTILRQPVAAVAT